MTLDAAPPGDCGAFRHELADIANLCEERGGRLLDGGRLIGWVGLARLSDWIPTAALPTAPADIEVGWYIGRDLWGHGLATEGARASADHAFHTLGFDRIVGIHNRQNAASQRVMEKLGMTLWTDVPHPRFEGIGLRIWELAAP